MIAFLNERSLETHNDWSIALRLFWQAAVELSPVSTGLFRDSFFFFGQEFAKRFGPTIGQVSPELRPLLRQVAFSDRYYKCWRPEMTLNREEAYHCASPELAMRDESVCEAAERKIREAGPILAVVSAPDSIFAGKAQLLIIKDCTHQEAELWNADSVAAVRQWIVQDKGYYDPVSKEAPRDFQTVLEKDSQRFSRTNRFWNVAGKDRRIYLETGTGRHFYVDESSFGPMAHLEVFAPDHKHFGIADIYTGVVDQSAKKDDRYISL